jgi:multidrug efflux pump subunit AcrB
VDHPRFDQQPGIRDHGHGRHRGVGPFAYNRLRIEQMPDVSLPYVLVLTAYPGANPEVVETDVTKPLEYAINTVAGASLIRSNSREGQSQVFAEFRMSTDMTKAMQDVRDKISQVRAKLPA